MRKENTADDEPLVDTAGPLPLRSKRTERRQKKCRQKEAAPPKNLPSFMNKTKAIRNAESALGVTSNNYLPLNP
jgi:hypothetical protein